MPLLVSLEVHSNSASLLDLAVIGCLPEYWSINPHPPIPTTTPDCDFPSALIPYDASQYTTVCMGPSPGVILKPLCPDSCDWCRYRIRWWSFCISCSVDLVTLVVRKATAPTHSNLHMRARYAMRATMLWKWSESDFCSLGYSSSIL